MGYGNNLNPPIAPVNVTLENSQIQDKNRVSRCFLRELLVLGYWGRVFFVATERAGWSHGKRDRANQDFVGLKQWWNWANKSFAGSSKNEGWTNKIWLVVTGCHFLFSHINWEFHHPNWLSYFSEGFKPPTRKVGPTKCIKMWCLLWTNVCWQKTWDDPRGYWLWPQTVRFYPASMEEAWVTTNKSGDATSSQKYRNLKTPRVMDVRCYGPS